MAKSRRMAVVGALWGMFRAARRPGAPGVWARLWALPRMFRAVRRGRYKGIPGKTLGLMVLSLVYIVSPIDLLPEFLPVIGVADDLGVGLWLLSTVLREAGDFVVWERENAGPAGRKPRVVPGQVTD